MNTIFAPSVRIIAFTIALAQTCAAGESMNMEFIPPAAARYESPDHGRWSIFLDGPIEDGAALRFSDELALQNIEAADVYLNSRGGALWEGLELGRLIRERGYATHVGRQGGRTSEPRAGECYSACVFAFIGGIYRFAPGASKIGVHRFAATSPADADPDLVQIVSATIINYLKKMGVDTSLFERMARAGKEQMLLLTEPDLRQLGVINDGRLRAQWVIEPVDGAMYLTGTQQTWQGAGKIMLSCKNAQVVFQPVFGPATDSAEQVATAQQHLIRFDNRYAPLSGPLDNSMRVVDGSVSGEFILNREQVGQLMNAAAIGYAAQLNDGHDPAGFTVDIAGSAAGRIRSFLNGCG